MFFGLLISERRFSFFIKIMKIQIRNLTVRDSKFEIKYWNFIQVYYSQKRCQYEVYIRGTDSNFKRVSREYQPLYPGTEIEVEPSEQIRD